MKMTPTNIFNVFHNLLNFVCSYILLNNQRQGTVFDGKNITRVLESYILQDLSGKMQSSAKKGDVQEEYHTRSKAVLTKHTHP